MKDKILMFVIGLLIGAIITSSGFLIYQKINKNTNTSQMPNDGKMQMMEKPDGEPPEKPSGNEDDSNRPEPPEKPNDSDSNSSEAKPSLESDSENTENNSTN